MREKYYMREGILDERKGARVNERRSVGESWGGYWTVEETLERFIEACEPNAGEKKDRCTYWGG